MIYRIEYSKAADKTLRKWKKSNPQLFAKAKKILLDIMEHPRSGLGCLEIKFSSFLMASFSEQIHFQSQLK